MRPHTLLNAITYSIQQRLGSPVSRSARNAHFTVSWSAPQAMIYLRKLCSHPLLALDESVPEHVAAVHAELGGSWTAAQQALHDTAHAPKLQALRELLAECGIGVEPGGIMCFLPSTQACQADATALVMLMNSIDSQGASYPAELLSLGARLHGCITVCFCVS